MKSTNGWVIKTSARLGSTMTRAMPEMNRCPLPVRRILSVRHLGAVRLANGRPGAGTRPVWIARRAAKGGLGGTPLQDTQRGIQRVTGGPAVLKDSDAPDGDYL